MIPPTKFLDALCPNDCGGHGKCIKGKCSCESGFGALDCTIDLNKPPTLDYLQEDGLCDLDVRRCKKIRAYGIGFLDSEKLACHFQPVEVIRVYEMLFIIWIVIFYKSHFCAGTYKSNNNVCKSNTVTRECPLVQVVFWLAQRARQNAARLVKLQPYYTPLKVSNKINLLSNCP